MEKASAPVWQTGTSHGSRLAAARAKSVKTEIHFEGGGGVEEENKDGWRRWKIGGGGEARGRDGLTIRAQRAHFTPTSSKLMWVGVRLVGGVEGRRGGEGEGAQGWERDFDLIWQLQTPSHSLRQKKGREA